ncbi:MAG: hypothetical protein R2774_14480 [Saprospiraceae bacterium]
MTVNLFKRKCSMNFNNKHFFYLIISLALLFGCKKEETYSFSTPSTYRFNSPSLTNRQVFAIQDSKYTQLIDSLGSFDKSNEEIADTLNVFIKQNFIDPFITEITLTDSKNVKLVISQYDTLTKAFTVLREENLGYTLVGNDVEITGYPNLSINIDTDFMELRLCKSFSERSIFNSDKNEYHEENCTTRDGESTINNIVVSNPSITYDTIGLEYVDFIYSKY